MQRVIRYRFCALATCLNDLMAQGASEQDAIAKASFFGALFLPQSSTQRGFKAPRKSGLRVREGCNMRYIQN
jgi:hypothetical protein